MGSALDIMKEIEIQFTSKPGPLIHACLLSSALGECIPGEQIPQPTPALVSISSPPPPHQPRLQYSMCWVVSGLLRLLCGDRSLRAAQDLSAKARLSAQSWFCPRAGCCPIWTSLFSSLKWNHYVCLLGLC